MRLITLIILAHNFWTRNPASRSMYQKTWILT